MAAILLFLKSNIYVLCSDFLARNLSTEWFDIVEDSDTTLLFERWMWTYSQLVS